MESIHSSELSHFSWGTADAFRRLNSIEFEKARPWPPALGFASNFEMDAINSLIEENKSLF
jgi:hypothetical protein